MITVYYILWSDTFFLGTDCDRHTVFIRTADKEYVFFFQSQITDIDICRHVYTCQMSDMNRPVAYGRAEVTVVLLKFFSIDIGIIFMILLSLIAHKGREILFYFLFLLIIEMYLIRFYSSGIRNSFCDRDQGVKSMK